MSVPLIVLVGTTASGKSSLAIECALALIASGQQAEIVNADSMAVYRGMDIGTAKPSMDERRGVRHHLIDIMGIDEPASVALFQDLARQAIEACRQAEIIPIVVGGSALYLHGIIDDFQFPPTDEDLRQRLTSQWEEIGTPAMYERLRSLNEQAARGIEPTNSRRIIRALEAIELTGGFSSTLPEWTYAMAGVHQIGLQIDRETMDVRIEARVTRMWEQGFVDEVRTLLDQGLRQSPTASRAIGYRQIIDFLDGEITEEEALERTVIRTRQFSRRQLAWWKRDPRITWVPWTATAQEVLPLVAVTPSDKLTES